VRLRTLLHCMPASAVVPDRCWWSSGQSIYGVALAHANQDTPSACRISRTSHAERLTRKKNTDKQRFSCLVTQLIEILIIDFSVISRLAGARKKR
jgi:ribulose kinase